MRRSISFSNNNLYLVMRVLNDKIYTIVKVLYTVWNTTLHIWILTIHAVVTYYMDLLITLAQHLPVSTEPPDSTLSFNRVVQTRWERQTLSRRDAIQFLSRLDRQASCADAGTLLQYLAIIGRVVHESWLWQLGDIRLTNHQAAESAQS